MPASLFKLPPQFGKPGSLKDRQVIEIEPGEFLAARVVLGADEPAIVRYCHSALGQPGPHLMPVSNRRENPGVGAAMATATRAAVMRGVMRIVLACGTMAHDDDQRR
jgi:hypothetical protein